MTLIRAVTANGAVELNGSATEPPPSDNSYSESCNCGCAWVYWATLNGDPITVADANRLMAERVTQL
jgi:hypothetical protein